MTEIEWNWLALSLVQDLGVQTLQHLLKHFGHVGAIVEAPATELQLRAGVSPKLAQRISQSRQVASYQIEQRLLRETPEIRFLCLESPEYPVSLQQIATPPPVLYWRGEFVEAEAPCIGFVGSRSCTSYGLRQTRRLVQELAELLPNVVIVSGLARGIDTAAHQAALEAGVRTIGVLASGLQQIYPPENQDLALALTRQGALVSEFPLTMKPHARNFPIRNRVISGLSQGVVIVEASEKSGALITAAFALQQNREVFALPGQIDAPASRGTNRLIARQHAKLITGAQDILDELAWTSAKARQPALPLPAPSAKPLNPHQFSTEQARLLQALAQGASDPDTLHQQTQIEIHQLLGMLIEFELQDFVHTTGGQTYELHPNLTLPEAWLS